MYPQQNAVDRYHEARRMRARAIAVYARLAFRSMRRAAFALGGYMAATPALRTEPR